MALKLEIVTPEAIVYSESVDSVVLPTRQGEVGIQPGHIPLLTMVEPGELQVMKGSESTALAVDKGFANVRHDQVSVLTEAAIDVSAIDLSAAAEAQKRAQEALETAEAEGLDPAEIERLESVSRFAIAQQLAKSKRR